MKVVQYLLQRHETDLTTETVVWLPNKKDVKTDTRITLGGDETWWTVVVKYKLEIEQKHFLQIKKWNNHFWEKEWVRCIV